MSLKIGWRAIKKIPLASKCMWTHVHAHLPLHVCTHMTHTNMVWPSYHWDKNLNTLTNLTFDLAGLSFTGLFICSTSFLTEGCPGICCQLPEAPQVLMSHLTPISKVCLTCCSDLPPSVLLLSPICCVPISSHVKELMGSHWVRSHHSELMGSHWAHSHHSELMWSHWARSHHSEQLLCSHVGWLVISIASVNVNLLPNS